MKRHQHYKTGCISFDSRSHWWIREEDKNEERFLRNTVFKKGQYEEQLLWKENHQQLNDNYTVTKRRLQKASKESLTAFCWCRDYKRKNTEYNNWDITKAYKS